MSNVQSVTQTLLSRSPPVLVPSAPSSLSIKKTIASLSSPPLVKAALNLANDDISGCHDIVEKMQGHNTADVLHAILHRREGDYWNSNWWWSRINHPLFPLTKPCKQFVNACEKHASTSPSSSDWNKIEEELRNQQWEEIGRVVNWVIDHESK